MKNYINFLKVAKNMSLLLRYFIDCSISSDNIWKMVLESSLLNNLEQKTYVECRCSGHIASHKNSQKISNSYHLQKSLVLKEHRSSVQTHP